VEAALTRTSGLAAPRARRRGLSIRAKLPIGVVLLLALACGALTGIAYLRVRAFVIGAASERIAQAATRVSELLAASARQRVTQIEQGMKTPFVIGYVRQPDPAVDATVRDLLRKAAGPGNVAELGLFDASGRRIVSTNETLPLEPGAETRAAIDANHAASIFSPMQKPAGAERPFYTMTLGIVDGDALIGYFVERRLTGGASETVTVISNLIGAQAHLTFGNARGDLWTSFAVPAASNGESAAKTAVIASDDGVALLTRMAPIAGTPWATGIGFPLAPVMAPIHAFLRDALVTTMIVIAIGALAGWIGSRRLTRPLAEVTDAAEAIADGRPAPPLRLTRRDEVGSLAASFTRMAERVTESRQALQQMVDDLEQRVQARTAALESANRELEAFSYSVSHDLRAPLRAVTGFATILVEDHASHLPPDGRECVEVIARRAKHMGQLIDDLLAFSRLCRTTITLEPVDLGAMARGVVDDITRADPSRAIVWDLRPLPPATGAPAMLQQVLVNLMQNAAKFSRTRRDARVTIGYEDTPRGPAYFVRDNGVGFDMQYADRLFGVFQRLHGQNEFEGTGVGLAIVHRIITRHGGAIWADAALDRGATFFFTLPSDSLGAAA
jgi:signal transduction histidine kinase